MICCELIVGNLSEIWLKGYHRQTAGTPIVDATVVANVLDASGVAISGGAAIALAHQADGDYMGTLPASAPLVTGGRYTIHVTDEANGLSDKLTLVARDRSGC